ncbi:DUF2795 domain-containing protein [Nonomuraea fuscirosea]|jgi:hypothetical protein|uniref:Uncharacterized protein DUF2795 n=1 Tax=Nonomuraea fuscirosea TaxID=1291556 RepID=A0A2T0N3B9_9ACTN|nr:DUF2795 domain-containing protein [Nonomuraea fuscirosea]PRX66652.1 uncharacterized protein DUF2795 [Nonomuraea fuscirosea]WSA54007.1 DUF2795 domain-containing protein [Nonomuraea fuscirosea]
MERGSDKHGPRLDEQQKHETEGMVRGGGTTHAEEWKEPESMPSAGEEPQRSYPPGHEPGVPEGMTQGDVDLRSDLAKWLSDTHWPASKAELLRRAERQGAPDRVVDLVESLPDRDFSNMADIAKALGIGVEQRRW